jgi:hypothetical protein
MQAWITPSRRLLRILGRLVLGSIHLMLGIGIGLLLLEVILHLNPHLLAGLRGLGAPAPLDAPLTINSYDVHFSDADEIYWRPDLIRSIPPDADQLEAHVVFETDELGFRNSAPLPSTADIVVLGRSQSLGAQNPNPWPDQLARITNWKVVNLSQPGSSLDVKRGYLTNFGLPRHPRWIILEVSPAMDSINYRQTSSLLIQLLPIPLAQQLIRSSYDYTPQSAGSPIYPLTVDLPGRTYQLTCCINFLDVLTIDQATLQQSRGWMTFTRTLSDLSQEATSHSACVAILYAPMKPEIYFPLTLSPSQLEPTLGGVIPLHLTQSGELAADPTQRPSVLSMRANALAGRDALATYAKGNNLLFIDPTSRMVEAVLGGADPFMVYDSHWNNLGHELIAQSVAAALQTVECH